MKKLLISFPLLAILAGCGAPPRSAEEQAQSATSDKKTALGRSMDMGKSVATNSNISQINSLLGMYKNDNEGKAPATLEEAKVACKGCTPEMWVDDVTGKPLQYDPSTGTVSRTP